MPAPLRDIRRQLPQLPQNDPNRYPAYQYKPYPRMMTREVDGKKMPYRTAAGQPVIVKNEAEEKAFLDKHGDQPKAAQPAAQQEAPRMTALEPVASAPAEEPRRGPGRPPKLKLPDALED